jgi:hypothetical protein
VYNKISYAAHASLESHCLKVACSVRVCTGYACQLLRSRWLLKYVLCSMMMDEVEKIDAFDVVIARGFKVWVSLDRSSL